MSDTKAIADQLLRAARDALLADGTPTVRMRALLDKEEGEAVRLLPWVTTASYFDGQRDYAVPLECYCRSHDQGAALAMASRALEVLSETDAFSGVTACDVTDISPYTGPTEWPDERYGMHSYVAGVRILITTTHSDFD